jgi:hypothetical protein
VLHYVRSAERPGAEIDVITVTVDGRRATPLELAGEGYVWLDGAAVNSVLFFTWTADRLLERVDGRWRVLGVPAHALIRSDYEIAEGGLRWIPQTQGCARIDGRWIAGPITATSHLLPGSGTTWWLLDDDSSYVELDRDLRPIASP